MLVAVDAENPVVETDLGPTNLSVRFSNVLITLRVMKGHHAERNEYGCWLAGPYFAAGSQRSSPSRSAALRIWLGANRSRLRWLQACTPSMIA